MTVLFISNDDLESRAEEFLAQYHQSRTIPVPIEEIVESDLRIEIAPIPGFAERFGIEGYISNDLRLFDK